MQYIYLIECKDGNPMRKYKIGVANDVRARLAALQTGCPYELELLDYYQFENAEIVERAIHQAFGRCRTRGEWFELNADQVEKEFNQICRLLGGYVENPVDVDVLEESEVDEAEQVSEPINGAKWDYAAMFKDGWFMEKGNSKKGDWRWRGKGKNGFLYGGLLKDLPYPLDVMRKTFGGLTDESN